MPGSKKKSDVNYREGMTLLEMDSDSDENIEHFALGGMNATTATRRRYFETITNMRMPYNIIKQ